MRILHNSTDPDAQAVLDHAMNRTPVPDGIYQRIKAESERLTRELRERYGETNMAADIVRDAREQ